jgi:long-chain fatty acid transport protein
MKRLGHLCTATLAAALVFLCTAEVFGAGLMVYNHDAKANGMGLAVIATIDNPSAVFYNPALLTRQPGAAFSLDDTLIMIERSYKDGETGVVTRAKATTHHVPSLFGTYTSGRFSYGIGVYSPFGLSVEWPQNWSGRYSSTFAEMKTIYVNPTFAFKFNDRVSAGIGISYVNSSLDFQNAINLSPFADGRVKMTADGEGVGANAGVSIRLPEDYSVALTYRSPVKINYDGAAHFYVMNSVLRRFLPDSDVSTSLTLPYWFTFGLAKKAGRLTVEGDVLYTGWSSIDKYVATFEDGRPPITYRKDWHNTFTYAIGINYEWSKCLETQLGYMYDVSPAPRRTFTPELPDTSRHLITGGIGYRKGPFKANVAYQATFFRNANSRGNTVGAPKGSYDTFIHALLFAVSYSY